MKKIYLFLLLLLVVTIVNAQQGFTYKAIITDSGSVLEEVEITVKFTIIESDGTTELYQEKQTDVLTDTNGIITLYIGEGDAVFGDFSTIDWSNNYFLKVEIETPTSGNYIDFGTTALKPVPYAKYAENGGAKEINDLNDAIYGINSLFLGNGSGTGNNTGNNNNTGIGKDALHSVTNGTQNTAIGYSTLYDNTSGGFNVAIGNWSLSNNQTGGANVAIGVHSLESNISGNDNVSIGNEAGFDCLGSGNIFIGNHSGEMENGSNKLYIDNSGTNTPLIGGDFDTDKVTINGDLKVTEKLTAPDSGSNFDMKAYAYGEMYDGSPRHESNNVTITATAEAGKYNITFNPVPSGTSSDYIVIANLYSDIGFCKVQKADNSFIVKTYNTAGTQVSKNFTFVMYKK